MKPYRSVHPYLDVPLPMVLAHQGDSVHAPENTLPAFDLAVKAGVDALETDIHWTKDGVIVISHDETVDRCSDGTGPIRSHTLAQLKDLDFGYRFTTDHGRTYPFRGRGVKIPTLQEVLKAFPTMRVNIDIKPRNPASLRRLLTDIYTCDGAKRVLIASFHHRSLQRIRRLDPRLATSASPVEAALWCLFGGPFWARPQRLAYVALQVPPTVSWLKVVTQRSVRRAHRLKRQVHVWTIDEAEHMSSLFKDGVDAIVTNDAALGVKVRNQFRQSV